MNWRKILVLCSVLYTLGLFFLLSAHFSNQVDSTSRAIIYMGLGLFTFWVLVGGFLQWRALPKLTKFFQTNRHPFWLFFIGALGLTLIEEAIATSMTNFAPLLGDMSGTAHITASAQYLDVIAFHSVIVFVPMLAVLGMILLKYDFSPWAAAVLWGGVGVLGEYTLAGPQVIVNAPFWLLVYGLMVYLPAHSFLALPRRPVPWLLTPVFLLLVAGGAIITFWIPSVFDHPSNHFLTTISHQ